jgi:hypothetical protein
VDDPLPPPAARKASQVVRWLRREILCRHVRMLSGRRQTICDAYEAGLIWSRDMSPAGLQMVILDANGGPCRGQSPALTTSVRACFPSIGRRPCARSSKPAQKLLYARANDRKLPEKACTAAKSARVSSIAPAPRLAIVICGSHGRSHLTHQPIYCSGGFRPALGGNMAGFSASASPTSAP